MINKDINGNTISNAWVTAVGDVNRDWIARFMVGGTEVDCAINNFTITKGSCGANDAFAVGSVCSHTLNATVKDLSTPLKGEEIEVQIGLYVNGAYEYITLGYFTANIVKKTAYLTNITGYGRSVTNTGGAFTPPSTMTLANIISEIQTECGCTVTVDNAIDTSITVTDTMAGMTTYQALQTVALLVGGYITDTYDGKIAIKQYSDTETLSVNAGQMIALPDVEEVDYEITGLQVIVAEATDDQPAIEYHSGTPNLIYNCTAMSQSMFDDNATSIIGYTYRSGTINLSVGDPRLEGDDVLEVTDVDGTTYNVPCHAVSHTYDGGLQTNVVASQYPAVENSIGTVMPITSKLNGFEGAVEGLTVLVEDLEQQVDGKIVTYAQATAPDVWATSDDPDHDGDLWFYTGTTNLTVGGVTIEPTNTYRFNGTTGLWVLYDSPAESLFDLADGKTTVWYGSTSTVTGMVTGDYLVDSTTGNTYKYNGSSWDMLQDFAQVASDASQASTDAGNALSIASTMNQNFWFKSTGTDTGAHITEVSQQSFITNPSGGNLLANSNGIAIRDGLTELASFGDTISMKAPEGDSSIEIYNGGLFLTDTSVGGGNLDIKGDSIRIWDRYTNSDTPHEIAVIGSGQEYEGSSTWGNYNRLGEGLKSSRQYQLSIGKYNDTSANNLFEIGNGTGDNARRNAFIVDKDGNVNIASGAKYKINGTNLSASDVGAVPTSRTVNSKALSSDISLTASDVGAVPTSRTVNSKALSSNISLSASDVGAVPTSRTVNSKALSSDITLTASDVGAVPTSDVTTSGEAGKIPKIGTNAVIELPYIIDLHNSTLDYDVRLTTTTSGTKGTGTLSITAGSVKWGGQELLKANTPITKVVKFTISSISIAASTMGSVTTHTFTAQSGYTPVGIVGWSTGSGTNMGHVFLAQAHITGATTFSYRLKNTASAAASGTIAYYVLFVKDGNSGGVGY